MGLDQYLYAEKYVSGWSHSDPQERQEMGRLAAAIPEVGDLLTQDSPHAMVSVCAIYWRKANAVHDWFVRECQDGVDDCVEHDVPREKLIELRDICEEIISGVMVEQGEVRNGYLLTPGGDKEAIIEEGVTITNPEFCAELLPTASGFFFGSTDYDQWYLHDIMHTKDSIDALLSKIPEDGWAWSFSYRSSW